MAVLGDIVDGVQAGVVVIAQPAGFVINHAFELRQPLRDGQDLVDLLLVFHHRKADVGVRQHVGDFVGDRVGIDRHRNRAKRLRGHHRPIEPRPVRADHRDVIAALNAEAGEPGRQVAHLRQYLLPGPNLPDAEILVPVSRPARIAPGIADQELGERVRLRGGVIARHGESSQISGPLDRRTHGPAASAQTPAAAVGRQSIVIA